jgi:hypothetical protein
MDIVRASKMHHVLDSDLRMFPTPPVADLGTLLGQCRKCDRASPHDA